MRGVRNTEFVVSLALLASLVCHVAIQRQFEHRAQSIAIANQNTSSVAKDQFSAQPSFDPSDFRDFKIPRFMEEAQHGANILAVLSQQAEVSLELTQQTDDGPSPVPAPADNLATDNPTIEEMDSDTAAVREVIEHELSHATREEREIWFEELKSLPAGVVSDLLQVRKQLHALPKLLGGMPEKLASISPTMSPRTQEISAEPASQKIRFNIPDQHSAASSLEVAISQLRHNLINAATPGFKRLRVTLVDAYGSAGNESSAIDNARSEWPAYSVAQGEGCRIAPLLLDLNQGLLKKTTRQLDVSIEGEGFFIVHQGDKQFLTRCGAFAVDCEGQLCLALTSAKCVLHPVIKIPSEAREIQISASGVVTVLKSADTELIQIAQLQLGRVASPSRLQPAGNTLLIANEHSGTVLLGSPLANGFGELQQGFLEQSNVDFARELEEIEMLTGILDAVPLQNSHPLTARKLPPAPAR